MKRYTHVLWDWNGTLLDDVDACVKSVNIMLEARSLPTLTKDRYKEVFSFPVRDYYMEIGFDFKREAFEDLAEVFHDYYERFSLQSPLHAHGEQVMKFIWDANIIQSVLSASEINRLRDQVSRFPITEYLNTFLGLRDIYANSKVEVGRHWLNQSHVDPKKVLMVGDTLHDYQVARALGCDCLLVTAGHQSQNRLEQAPCPKAADLDGILDYL